MKNLVGITLLSAAFMVTPSISFAQPGISVQPVDQNVNQSFNATFQTMVSGTPPLSYQWFFASKAVAGAITNVLTVTDARPTNAGDYFVVVSNSAGSVTSRVATLTVNLPTVLDPKLGANTRIGADLAWLPGPHQAELHLARSYADSRTLLASFQDGIGRMHAEAAPACAYAVSADGGLTWQGNLIPGLTTASGGKTATAVNLVTAVGAEGNLYIASLLRPVSPAYTSQMVVSPSVDLGQNFGQPLVAAKGNSSDWPDKEWMTIDTFPGSPHPNRIALAYWRKAFVLDTYSIYSDDAGVTWSEPKLVGTHADGAQNVFLPDGSLAIFYWRFLDAAWTFARQRIEMVLSKDGGTTFGPPTIVQDTSKFDHPNPSVFATMFFTSVCTDRQAGVIYLTLGATTGAQTNRAARILFTKSIDQGKTWSAPVQINDTPPGKTVFTPAIAASPDGQHVTVLFYDGRNDPGQGKLVDAYLAESFDGGDTWEPGIRLSEFSSDFRKAPLEVDYNTFFLGDYQGMVPSLNFETPAVAAWIDTRAGNADPYMVRIRRTRGTTFDTWRKLRWDTNSLANAAVSGENADPDGDGIPNLAEYALGLEPGRPNPAPLNAFISGSTAPDRISYERLAVLSDIRFDWQKSTNLKDWVPTTPLVTVVGAGRDPSMQRVEVGFAGGSDACFFRLSMERIP